MGNKNRGIKKVAAIQIWYFIQTNAWFVKVIKPSEKKNEMNITVMEYRIEEEEAVELIELFALTENEGVDFKIWD